MPGTSDDDRDLRALLETLDPKACELRRLLIRDHADRDTISSQLLRYRDQNGDGSLDNALAAASDEATSYSA